MGAVNEVRDQYLPIVPSDPKCRRGYNSRQLLSRPEEGRRGADAGFCSFLVSGDKGVADPSAY
jgi:hypothetical protein